MFTADLCFTAAQRHYYSITLLSKLQNELACLQHVLQNEIIGLLMAGQFSHITKRRRVSMDGQAGGPVSPSLADGQARIG